MTEKIENTLEELLFQYTYYYGMRRTNKDKQQAYGFIAKKFGDELGYSIKFDKFSVGVTKIGLCTAGNIEKADIVFVAPFDTPKKTCFYPYKFYPLNENSSKMSSVIRDIVNYAVLGILLALVFAVVWYFGWNRWIGIGVMLLIAVFYSFIMNHNIFNFNGTASLALMNYMALNNQKNKDRFAFVFLDEACTSYIPLRLFLIKYSDALKHCRKIVYLDNLASSEELLCVRRSDCPDSLKFEDDLHLQNITLGNNEGPHCFDPSAKLIMLSASDKDKKDRYFVKGLGSKKDKNMNVKRLKRIAEQFTV